MSKIQLIEQELLAINDAKFHIFCNEYLNWIGYDFLTSSGSVIGKEKSKKGTPDAYIPINENQYCFVEYTTKDKLGKSKGFFNKLSLDIDHCFDESQSKISNSQIKKVILCFTQRLTVSEHNLLREKCAHYGAELETHDIDKILKQVLFHPYLGQYLGISIDTQQLLPTPVFVKEYEQGKLATPLSNKIYFREEEINNALNLLDLTNILIIEGSAGVGKSRFALEILSQFCNSNPTFKQMCVDNKGCPIYEDIRVYLKSTNDFILLIDDANRSYKHYEFILNLLKEDREGKVKIVATVRDYALNVIEHASKNYEFQKIKVKPLSDIQIREILASEEFKITNRDYSDVIVRVAQGNPRLAIMAAKVALERQNLSAFNDIPKIYESYYDEVVTEINELGDTTFLKVLGIISFFKTIGKGHGNIEQNLSSFGLSESEFWEKVITLNQMELVDLFENEVVKISDQILASYFFYIIFIRDGLLDFGALITQFYENQQGRFRDMIYSVANTFGYPHIKEKLSRPLDQSWAYFEKDDVRLLKFLSLFWIFKQERVLSYIGKAITTLPDNPQEEYKFEEDKNPNTWDDEYGYFEVLKQFLNYTYLDSNFKLALDLTFLYLEKQPEYIRNFVAYAKAELIYNREDYNTDFYRQTTLFDKLISNINSGRNPTLFRGLFYHIVNTYLQTAFQKSESAGRDNSIAIYIYHLPNISILFEFRQKIWNFLFEDFRDHKKCVIDSISSYIFNHNIWGATDVNNKKAFWEYDSKLLLPFIVKNFNKESYKESKTAQEYFTQLEHLEIPFNSTVFKVFNNYKLELSLKLNQDIVFGEDKYDLAQKLEFKSENGNTEWKKVENLKYEELEKFVHNLSLEELKKLWQDINELLEEEVNKMEWSINISTFQILRIIAIKDTLKFLKLFEFIFDANNMSESFSSNYCQNITANLLKSLKGKHKLFFDLINKYNGRSILHWKFAFFIHLESEYVSNTYTNELLRCFKSIERHWTFFKFDFLDKYSYPPSKVVQDEESLFENSSIPNTNIYTEVTSILIDKVKKDEASICFDWDFISDNSDKFLDNVELLRQVYFSNFRCNNHFDVDGKEMKVLCELHPDFLIDFMREFYEGKDFTIPRELPLHNFKFVWEHDNFIEVIDSLMEFSKVHNIWLADFEHFANKLFNIKRKDFIDKQLYYIKNFIERNSDDKVAIRLIFNIINYSFSDKRIEFLKLFLHINQDPQIFESLTFYSSGGIYSGSRIPKIERNIEKLNQIHELLESLSQSGAFIEHRIFIKNEIEYLRRDITRERKREFESYYG
jgi:predicted Zn-dependent protease with MMP-like domain